MRERKAELDLRSHRVLWLKAGVIYCREVPQALGKGSGNLGGNWRNIFALDLTVGNDENVGWRRE